MVIFHSYVSLAEGKQNISERTGPTQGSLEQTQQQAISSVSFDVTIAMNFWFSSHYLIMHHVHETGKTPLTIIACDVRSSCLSGFYLSGFLMRLETNLFGQINQWYPLRITKLKKSRDHSPAPLLLPSFLWMPWSMPRFSLRQKRSQAKRAGSTNVGSATSMILAAWHRAATHGLLAVTGCWIIEKTSLCWWQHMQSLPWLLEPTLSASGVSWRFSLQAILGWFECNTHRPSTSLDNVFPAEIKR